MHCFAGTGVFSCQPILPDGAGEEAGLLTHGGSSAGKDWGRELQCVEFKKLMVHVRQEPTKLEFFLEREEFNLRAQSLIFLSSSRTAHLVGATNEGAHRFLEDEART